MKYTTAICACPALLSIAPTLAQAEDESAAESHAMSASSVTMYGLIAQVRRAHLARGNLL